jgi:hypothetical protein
LGTSARDEKPTRLSYGEGVQGAGGSAACDSGIEDGSMNLVCINCHEPLVRLMNEAVYACRNPECERPIKVSELDIMMHSDPTYIYELMREQYAPKSILAQLLDEMTP